MYLQSITETFYEPKSIEPEQTQRLSLPKEECVWLSPAFCLQMLCQQSAEHVSLLVRSPHFWEEIHLCCRHHNRNWRSQNKNYGHTGKKGNPPDPNLCFRTTNTALTNNSTALFYPTRHLPDHTSPSGEHLIAGLFLWHFLWSQKIEGLHDTNCTQRIHEQSYNAKQFWTRQGLERI